ncbi:MAG: hypothetical protein C4558_09330 [Dehalococcoidia bacterium]|nr:MAG: hypothetical protein C4558_09330 [Dehalococcoidia bacterium]
MSCSPPGRGRGTPALRCARRRRRPRRTPCAGRRPRGFSRRTSGATPADGLGRRGRTGRSRWPE